MAWTWKGYFRLDSRSAQASQIFTAPSMQSKNMETDGVCAAKHGRAEGEK